ncbi:MAG: T9SS type A sorting domain-containing protein [Flavobacteriia bacterium]
MTVNTAPTIALGTVSNPSACSGTDGSIQITGTGTGDVTWSGTASGSATATTLPYTLSSLSAGTYNFTFDDGCLSNTVSATITDPGAPAAPTITASGATTFCSGGSVTLTSSSATNNVWSNGATTQTITISASGSYSVDVTTAGCTSSSAATAVTVNTAPTIALGTVSNPSACSGTDGSIQITGTGTGDVTWSGTASGSATATTLPYTLSSLAAGTYNFTFDDGCVSNTVSATITDPGAPAAPTITASGATTFCSGGSVTLTSSSAVNNVWSNGATTQTITVTASGSYSVDVTTAGCTSSSTNTVTVVVNPTPTTPIISAGSATTFCNGGSVTLTSSSALNNTWSTGETTQSIIVSTTGNYNVTVSNLGCAASSANTSVIVNNPTSGSETISACDSFTWPTDGNTYSATGAYSATLTNALGCDSIVTLNLTINNSSAGSETITACDSYTWPTDGNTYSSTGTYTTTLTNAMGCDSIVTLNLTINNSSTGSETITACDSYTWPTDGNTYSSTGTYTTTLTNALGCDSLVTLNLIINYSSSGSETITACDSYTWPTDGNTYSSTGTFTTTLTNALDCDSLVTLNLTINNSSVGSETITACDSYTWPTDGNTYSSTGTYTTTLTNALGCDSIVTLNLTINNSSTGSETITACDSFTWSADGNTYSTSGTYSATLTNALGCDSIVTLNLTINNSSAGSETIIACDSYTWPTDGNTYATSGTYSATLTNALGCDSIVTLNLTINNSSLGSETITACDSFTWPTDGNTYSSTGTYTTTLTNAMGCDSIVTLNLTINNSSAGSETITACDSYTWPTDGNTYAASGTYSATLTNTLGCDSIVTLNLTINNSSAGSETITACDSFTWSADGNTYSTSGTYSATLTNALGCDSIVTLNLTINNSSAGSETITACDSYTWPTDGNTYSATGAYSATLTNALGCDSIVTLNLTINNSSTGSETITACDSYTWPTDGNTYSATGTYSATLTNALGCDSIVTLNLTINNSSAGSETIIACDSYTWPTDGNTYATSGTYSATLTNALGCDSIVTLNLTINNSSAGSETITACDSYTWPADGNTYSTSGTYSATLTNALGCDSIVTLNLTINNSSAGSETITACDSYTWSTDGNTYTASGTYSAIIASSTGCDSLVTLNLTINSAPNISSTSPLEVCQAEEITLVASSTSAILNWYSQASGGTVIGEGNNYTISEIQSATTVYVEAFENGCSSARIPVDIIVNGKPQIAIGATNSNCGLNDGTASAIISQGTAPYSFYWSDGTQDQLNISNLVPGAYYFNVLDAKGCKAMAVTEVNPSTITMTPSVVNPTCFGANNGSISLAISGVTEIINYLWNTGSQSTGISNLFAGTYEVTITTESGCELSSSFVLTEPSLLQSEISEIKPNCGVNNGQLTVSNTNGGNGPYLYSWSNGQFGLNNMNLTFGVYTLTTTDQAGCQAQNTVFLSENNAPIVEGLITETSCNAETGAIDLDVTPVNGDLIQAIVWSNGETTEDISNLAKGNYVSFIRSQSNCVAVNGWNVAIQKPLLQEICIVTVDSVSTTNLVVWEKVQPNGVDYYNIYRESNQVDEYQLIDTVDFNNLSVFNDVVASPLARSWRYKIAAVDACGTVGPLSAPHKTLHLNTFDLGVSGVKVTWDGYEGNAFSNYTLWRYTDEFGWEDIAILPSNILTFTDATSFGTPGLDYMVEITLDVPCTATVWRAQDFNRSRSNKERGIFNPGDGAVDENGDDYSNNSVLEFENGNISLNVYPNPFKETISLDLVGANSINIQLFDMHGKLILENIYFEGNNSINLSSLENGIYFIKSQIGNEIKTMKIIKN